MLNLLVACENKLAGTRPLLRKLANTAPSQLPGIPLVSPASFPAGTHCPPPYLLTTHFIVSHTHLSISHPMARKPLDFEDHLPIMAEKLGGEALMEELCNGFRLLMDPNRGVITFESLKRGAGLLGLEGLNDGELREMMREGDIDGDGALSEMEFCVLMVRLSPELMEVARHCEDEAFLQTLGGGFGFL